jgi:hypothetical protein
MTDKNEYRSLLAEAERHLSGKTNAAANDRIKLRDAVCAFFAAERARGISIGAVQASVEKILLRAEAGAGHRADGHRELARQLIDWCVRLDPLPVC